MSSPQHILRLAVFGSNALKASVGGPPPRETAGEAVTQQVPGKSWALNIQKQLSPGRCSWGKLPACGAEKPQHQPAGGGLTA